MRRALALHVARALRRVRTGVLVRWERRVRELVDACTGGAQQACSPEGHAGSQRGARRVADAPSLYGSCAAFTSSMYATLRSNAARCSARCASSAYAFPYVTTNSSNLHMRIGMARGDAAPRCGSRRRDARWKGRAVRERRPGEHGSDNGGLRAARRAPVMSTSGCVATEQQALCWVGRGADAGVSRTRVCACEHFHAYARAHAATAGPHAPNSTLRIVAPLVGESMRGLRALNAQ